MILFQFHYGSIKIAKANYLAFRDKRFQFHYGSIKISRRDAMERKSLVSIPQWFDNNPLTSLASSVDCSFNSTMVR